MSLHRLTAGAGYAYLLRHTACGDVQRAASTPLTAYYTEAGYPPGRWLGAGLSGLADGRGLADGSTVTEEQMAALYGHGCDPVTAGALGRRYPVHPPLAERIARRVDALPDDLDPEQRAARTAEIETAERARRTPAAVAGFDLTFTVPKSASVLWALADRQTQGAVAEAHRVAVRDALAFLEERALFTRTGAAGCAQVATRGLIAAAFDHWDTRTGDPNLHTHVVIANKVQGPDGAWRSLDSRALHHAVVAVSELYDDLLADHLAARLPVRWGWRNRGERRTPAYELDGIEDTLLTAFSTRSVQVDAAMRDSLTDFAAAHGRGPTRAEILRLRQHATRSTRPAKTPHPLLDLLTRWREQAQRLTGRTPTDITNGALRGGDRPLRSDQVSSDTVQRLAHQAVGEVMARRSVWTPWNALTEAARITRGVRMATTADRIALLDRVAAAVLAGSTPLDPPEVVPVPAEFRRPDGSSVFTRPGEHAYSHPLLLDAEERLLDANTATGAPSVPEHVAHRVASAPQRGTGTGAAAARPVRLAEDQVAAVTAIATSGHPLDVLVGPAGTGKTTTLRALRAAWETGRGRGSVVGLAPSATAAHELSAALAIPCENTAKWLHETSGEGGRQRLAVLAGLTQRRAQAAARGDGKALRRLDLGIGVLLRERQHWSLRPGQLLIVDEASLAGTLTLDALRQQACDAGAKLLLVGDHHQLSAVDAGGAFRLLAESGGGMELRSLWRFRHRWEAGATRRLRHGDPDVIGEYEEHGRIHAGPAETMLEDAYRGWQASEHDGRAAVLVAADNPTIHALNTRAHDDRVTAGLVAPDGIPLGAGGDRGRVGAGDRVVTRRNQRSLTVPGHGHVRNGSLWTVVDTHPDGSLTVSPADRHVSHGCAPDPASVVTLPAAYVAEHVDLGYATTAHRAQGLTVEACHVLAGAGMTREALYVAMTRGRDANTVYVATDTVDPTCDHVPDPQAERTARDILEAILATSGAEVSATRTRHDRAAAATTLATLAPIRDTLLAHADLQRWESLLTTCGLTAEQADSLLASPARGALFAALREGEHLGHPMPDVLTRLITGRALEGGDEPAHDIAAVLHQRIDRWLDTAPTPRPGTEGSAAQPPPAADPATPDLASTTREALRHIEQIMARAAQSTSGTLPPDARPASVRPSDSGVLRDDRAQTLTVLSAATGDRLLDADPALAPGADLYRGRLPGRHRTARVDSRTRHPSPHLTTRGA